MRFITSYGVALALLLLIGGWLISGTLIQGGNGPGNGEQPMINVVTGEERVASTEEIIEEDEEPAALQSVRTVTYQAQPMQIQVALRGRTKASATVSARAETNGILDSVHVSKGQSVVPGDLLCTLDSGTRRARLAQATAALAQADAAFAQARADFDTNEALRNKGLAPANTKRGFQVALTAAISGKSASILAFDDAEAELARTEIRAEVEGLIQEPLANAGDMFSPGTLCATIIQLDPMLFVGKVAEAKIGLVQTGLPVEVVTVTGQTVKGEVSYLASTADSATRSFTVEVTIDNSAGAIRDGVTASANILVGVTEAHLVPQSVLTLDSDGTIGIKAVQDDVSKFLPVTLVRDTADGVWVAGLPQSLDIIILGQEYVVDGQSVAASRAGEGANS